MRLLAGCETLFYNVCFVDGAPGQLLKPIIVFDQGKSFAKQFNVVYGKRPFSQRRSIRPPSLPAFYKIGNHGCAGAMNATVVNGGFILLD